MTAILFLVFLVVVTLVLWRMWFRGEISGFAPRTRQEKIRLCWLIAGVVNFLGFLVHGAFDHGCFAFPTGGRLVNGLYVVTQHGKDYTFTPGRYLFSCLHGVFFVIVYVVCMIAVWRLKRRQAS
jgi:hypothetical protein